MNLSNVYEETIKGPWETGGFDVQFRIIDEGEMAIISFQGSVSAEDWKLDFSFPVKPYRDMPETWYAHGGFVSGYKSINDRILERVADKKFIFIEGYSLGGAYAVLCTEDIKFHHPEMDTGTITFGCPNVFWFPGKKVRERCKDILHVRNIGDPVPAVPPRFFGYVSLGSAKYIGSVKQALSLEDFDVKNPLTYPLIKSHQIGDYRMALRGESIARQTSNR